LVIGLGNPLMGDEGIGWHVIDQLRGDPRLPEDTDLLWGGTDLLACAAPMEGRRRIILVDALLDAAPVGSVTVWGNGEGLRGLADRQGHAHHLSLTQALQLLPLASPSLGNVQFRLVAVSIHSVRMQPQLSPALAAEMPHILNRVLQELAET
jgi:hydrogenase maturation protease